MQGVGCRSFPEFYRHCLEPLVFFANIHACFLRCIEQGGIGTNLCPSRISSISGRTGLMPALTSTPLGETSRTCSSYLSIERHGAG